MGKRSYALRYSRGDRIFLLIDTVLLLIIGIIILYPLLFIISASLSASVNVMGLSLIPREISFIGYETVLRYKDIWSGYYNSLLYTVLGTTISLGLTICCAYPLSRHDFKLTKPIMVLCMITMYFSGGLIPTYLTVRNLGMLDTIWSVILPSSMSVYNMIVMRTYFGTQIPLELLESSQLDGCNNLRYLTTIVLPLSGAILAVIGLFYAVGYWNSYFDAMIYLSSRNRFPLSIILREILIINTANIERMDIDTLVALETRQNVMKYSVIVVASLPVMILYPFVQKYFVKGVMIGAVKG
ncbi:MAG: carbohydrate ABC transporter permease [Christensenellales bacterium]|jgi:putative aldouronate transport system permease protein